MSEVFPPYLLQNYYLEKKKKTVKILKYIEMSFKFTEIW